VSELPCAVFALPDSVGITRSAQTFRLCSEPSVEICIAVAQSDIVKQQE
jgi:hypothetical protein